MKIFVLAILTATSINVFAETCPDVDRFEDLLNRAKTSEASAGKAQTIEYYETLVNDAYDKCGQTAKYPSEKVRKEAQDKAVAEYAKTQAQARDRLLWKTDARKPCGCCKAN